MGIIGSFQVFTGAFLMTQGGPANSTLFTVLYLYRLAFEQFKMGYASALAWLLFIIILFFTLIQLRLSESWVYYEGG
jgi:multiple sugar transport system permease protein